MNNLHQFLISFNYCKKSQKFDGGTPIGYEKEPGYSGFRKR